MPLNSQGAVAHVEAFPFASAFATAATFTFG